MAQQDEKYLKSLEKEMQGNIENEVRKYDIKYSELSLTMRTLLAAVYVRAHKDAMQKVRSVASEDENNQT